MFEIIQFIKDSWYLITPVFFVDQTDEAVHLCGGRFKRIQKPGAHWKWPLWDKIIKKTMVTTTVTADQQSLSTRDGHSIVVEAVIKYKIVDLEMFYTEIYDAVDALCDTTQGVVFEVIRDTDWEDCPTEDTQKAAAKKVRAKAKRYGIEIEEVTFSSMDRIRTIRLMSGAVSGGVL